VAPLASTNYKVVRGQVEVPPDAATRKGFQPVVDLKANGAVRTEVAVGEPVKLTAKIDTPPNAGSIVAADWDFEGTGAYADAAQLSNTTSTSATMTTTHAYTRPGVYFAAIRATSHRQADAVTPYARVQNLGRVRVVVR
jgi:PKD domain